MNKTNTTDAIAPVKFHLRFERDCTVPCIWCELCTEEITDATMAMVYWQDYRRAVDRPLVVHKRCMSGSMSRELAYPLSMELSTYLAFLLQNVGLGDVKKLQVAIRNAGLMQTMRLA